MTSHAAMGQRNCSCAPAEIGLVVWTSGSISQLALSQFSIPPVRQASTVSRTPPKRSHVSCRTPCFRKLSDVRSETRKRPCRSEIISGALGRAAQYRAVSGNGLAGKPRADPGDDRAASDKGGAAGGCAVVRQADHRRGRPPFGARSASRHADRLGHGGEIDWLMVLVLVELGLAVLSDLLARLIGLVDTLLSEKLTMSSSVRLMDHAATLDREDFEDSQVQDQLERALIEAACCRDIVKGEDNMVDRADLHAANLPQNGCYHSPDALSPLPSKTASRRADGLTRMRVSMRTATCRLEIRRRLQPITAPCAGTNGSADRQDR